MVYKSHNCLFEILLLFCDIPLHIKILTSINKYMPFLQLISFYQFNMHVPRNWTWEGRGSFFSPANTEASETRHGIVCRDRDSSCPWPCQGTLAPGNTTASINFYAPKSCLIKSVICYIVICPGVFCLSLMNIKSHSRVLESSILWVCFFSIPYPCWIFKDFIRMQCEIFEPEMFIILRTIIA